MKTLNEKQRALVVKLYHEKNHAVGEICQIVGGISRPTLYEYVKAAGGNLKVSGNKYEVKI